MSNRSNEMNNEAKQYRRYDRAMKKSIIDDVNRFSRLHMWFRYLPLDGKEYLIFPWKGQQPKNPITQEINDKDGLHWWIWDSAFIDEIPIYGVGKDILMRYKVTLNCFLRGDENNIDGSVYVKGWAVILSRYPHVMDVLRKRYDSMLSSEFHGDINMYFKLEKEAQTKRLLNAAKNIIALFQQNCPEWLNTELDPAERKLNRNFSLDSIDYHSMSGSPPKLEMITRTRSDSREHHNYGTKHHSDSTKHHSDSTKHHSDSTKHHSDSTSDTIDIDEFLPEEHHHHFHHRGTSEAMHKIASIFKRSKRTSDAS
jgi:hypothetical protein